MKTRPVEENIPWQKRPIAKTLLAVFLLLAVSIPVAVPPEDIPFPGCAFHAWTGRCCPTCGMTRSLHAFSHGDWTASFRYHIMGPLVFLGTLLLSAALALEAVTGRKVTLTIQDKSRRGFCLSWVGVWFLYWGVRLIIGWTA